MNEEQKKSTVIQNIKCNYRQMEYSLAEQLFMKQDLHGPTTGSVREDIWKQLFQMILPKKFVMEQSVFIIDSEEGMSREVDLAIIDETYTPYIFRYDKIKFIPIEAVAVVVECKSKTIKEEGINSWYEQIYKLRTAQGSIVRMAANISTEAAPTQQSTRPLCILCRVDKEDSKISDGIKEKFDFIITAKKRNGNGCIEIKKNQKLEDLWAFYTELNFFKQEPNSAIKGKESLEERRLEDYEVKDSDDEINTLLTFNLQLNQLLMLINNPIFFPHQKYAKMFNRPERSEGYDR